MGFRSVAALIYSGDIGGDHFLLTPREKALRELQRIRDVNDRLEQVGTQAEALENVRHLAAPWVLFHPVFVDVLNRAGRLIVGNPLDPRHGIDVLIKSMRLIESTLEVLAVAVMRAAGRLPRS